MSSSRPQRPAPRRGRSLTLVLLLAVGAALLGVPLHRELSSSAAPASEVLRGEVAALLEGRPSSPPTGVDDGAVPDGVTVFDDEVPAVGRLDPALLDGLRQAATDAADEGIGLVVNSGWRSPEYQERLLQEAVSEYGSAEEAARWVATPDTSAHVSGDAVDLGPSEAATWLSQHGATYGLCQTYGNEPWHYELRPEAVDQGCPPSYADPTQDPRMQR